MTGSHGKSPGTNGTRGQRHGDHDAEELFTLPTAPGGQWDHLTTNEKAWIEFIRVISCGSDPKVTPTRVRALRALLDAG